MDEHVLLVEDDPSIREVASLGLEQAGFRVTATGDGRDALQRFKAGPFDLVVLDVMLPSLDGLEVCREIRRESQMPIVMLSAGLTVERRSTALIRATSSGSSKGLVT